MYWPCPGIHRARAIRTGRCGEEDEIKHQSTRHILIYRKKLPLVAGLGRYKYELRHDGSKRAYGGVVDLRPDKVANNLLVANFRGTRAFLPRRFEDLNANGTTGLLRDIDEATGLRAKFYATLGNARRSLVQRPITKHR